MWVGIDEGMEIILKIDNWGAGIFSELCLISCRVRIGQKWYHHTMWMIASGILSSFKDGHQIKPIMMMMIDDD